MKKTFSNLFLLCCFLIFISLPKMLWAQPKVPVSQWQNKTILFVGAHPDDDAAAHGTMAMLADHGNEVYVLILTSGNVGTKDPDITRFELAKIRRQEEVSALNALGIPENHYINLGYTDGMVDFASHKDIVRRIVYWIRKLQPDVMIAFDPGFGFKYWRKTDHRAAARLATDAARAAEWRLLYPGQIIQKGLKAWWIKEYLFFGGLMKFNNTKVDVTSYVDQMVNAYSKYISQYSTGWFNYKGPDVSDLSPKDAKKFMRKVRKHVHRNDVNGKSYEYFRYYTGNPDGVGRRPKASEGTGVKMEEQAKKAVNNK